MSDQDQLVIAKINKGDYSAYRHLVEKYKDMIFNLMYQICKDEDNAQDYAQIAFIKAYQNLHKFRNKSSFSTWLYRIAYNTCLTQMRLQKKNHISIENEEVKNLENMENAIDHLHTQDRQRYLDIAIEKLDIEERALINLYYHEEKKLNEIAEIVNISHANARVKLLRTRNKLLGIMRKLLNKELYEL